LKNWKRNKKSKREGKKRGSPKREQAKIFEIRQKQTEKNRENIGKKKGFDLTDEKEGKEEAKQLGAWSEGKDRHYGGPKG